MQPMPPPVYVAFVVCLLGGALAVAEVVEYAMQGVASGDTLGSAVWAVINFWVARGLSRRATTAKMLVEIFVVLTLFACVLVSGVLVLSLLGVVDGEMEGGARGVLFLAIYAAVAFYLWRGMHSPSAIEWFRGGTERGRDRSTVGFKLRTLMVMTAAFAVAFASIDWRAIEYESCSVESNSRGDGNGGVLMFTIGTRDLRSDPEQKLVDFVVMESTETGKLNSRVTSYSSVSSHDSSAGVNLPSGEFLSLPGEIKLIEIRGDGFRTSTRGVTWPQLKGYLDSEPAIPSIDDLLAFDPEASDSQSDATSGP